MALYNHWYGLLLFLFFHHCHFMDECNHSFWSPIPPEILFGNILKCLFTTTMPLYNRCCGFLLFLSFFIVVASWMIETTCFDCRFHHKYLFYISYYLFCWRWWYQGTIYCYIICYKYVIVSIYCHYITQSLVSFIYQ